MTHPVRLLTAAEVLKLTGYKSRTTLWRRVKAGTFPAPVALSSHATRWPSDAVEAHLRALPRLDYGAEAQGGDDA
jgi:prophage regulatory protein